MPTESSTLSAIRSGSGALKASLWRLTGNNAVRILYGNEPVNFVHLRKDSVSNHLISQQPVTIERGDAIGRIGNAGSSGGPHMHIEAIRVRSDLLDDVPELMKRIRAGELETVGDIRPLQFHGVLAMRSEDVQPGGEATNPLAPWDGHGAYFQDYLVLPPSEERRA